MKRYLCLLLAFGMLLSLCACGKKKTEEDLTEGLPAGASTAASSTEPMAIQITLENLYNYFEYKEYPAAIRSEDGEKITSVQVSYGLQLRPEYTAAYPGENKDTMEIVFEATGVVNEGEYTVNFDTLQYSGTTANTSSSTVSETLNFWAKGDRTTVWTFGNYSSTYILYLENFRVVSAKGTIYLVNAPQEPVTEGSN